MRFMIAPVVLALLLLAARSATAQSLPANPDFLRPGDLVPRTTVIIGVDGESQPKPYGLVIHDGRHVALVEAVTRKVITVTSDQPEKPGNPLR